jgi:hypothetical protein
MFSKAGRITSAKYVVFQKKQEILDNQRKFLKVSALPLMRLDLEKQKEDQNKNFLEEELAPKPKVIVSARERPNTAPFDIMISRAQVERTKGNRHPPPPPGTYNPRFNVVQRTSSALFDYGKERAKPLDSSRATTARPFTTPDERLDSEFNPEKPKKRVVGIPIFGGVTSRDQWSRPNSSHDVHEERFKCYKMPASFSKTRRVPGFNLRNVAGREAGRSRRNERALPDYAPNHEFGKRQLGSSGPAFNKLTGRTDPAYVSYSINEDWFNTDRSLLLKYNKTRTTEFSRDLPREKTPGNPFPSFMQKGNFSRLGMEMGGQYTLEINNFSEARFQTNQSSFSPPPTSGTRPSTKLNTWRL